MLSFGGRVCLKSNLLGKGRIWPKAGHLLGEDGEKDGQVYSKSSKRVPGRFLQWVPQQATRTCAWNNNQLQAVWAMKIGQIDKLVSFP